MLLAGCMYQGALDWTSSQTRSNKVVPYDTMLVKWTRHTTAYRDLDSVLFARATLLSPAFIDAYGRELSRVSGMGGSHVEKLKSRLTGSGAGELRFLLTMLTADPHWNDLETDTPSMTVNLLSSSPQKESTQAENISVISEDEMADLRTMFTGIDPMAKGYLISFPMPASLESVTLRISGPPTYADLRWAIRR